MIDICTCCSRLLKVQVLQKQPSSSSLNSAPNTLLNQKPFSADHVQPASRIRRPSRECIFRPVVFSPRQTKEAVVRCAATNALVLDVSGGRSPPQKKGLPE